MIICSASVILNFFDWMKCSWFRICSWHTAWRKVCHCIPKGRWTLKNFTQTMLYAIVWFFLPYTHRKTVVRLIWNVNENSIVLENGMRLAPFTIVISMHSSLSIPQIFYMNKKLFSLLLTCVVIVHSMFCEK